MQQEAPQRMRGQPPGLQWERPQRRRGRLPERLRGRTLLQHLNDILLMRGFLEAEGQMFNGPPLRLLRRLRISYELLDSNRSTSSVSSTRGLEVCRMARGLTDRLWNGSMKIISHTWDGVTTGEKRSGASYFQSTTTKRSCYATTTAGLASLPGRKT